MKKLQLTLSIKAFRNVFQLKGGILSYLKKIKKEKSLWKGECYVFDSRISLKHKFDRPDVSEDYQIHFIYLLDKKSKKYEDFSIWLDNV